MVTFYHTVRFKSVCQAYYLSIYLYLSIYESNHIRLSLSIQAYIPIYLSIVVTMYPHLPTYLSNYLSIYLSIHPSIHPHKSTYLSVCVPIYLTLTPMRLCMSVYPFINISSCLSMYHSTMYLCTHPLSIYLCIRPSIHLDTDPTIHFCVSISSIYLSIHPHQCTYSALRVCLSISIGSSPTTHAPDDKHR